MNKEPFDIDEHLDRAVLHWAGDPINPDFSVCVETDMPCPLNDDEMYKCVKLGGIACAESVKGDDYAS